MRTDNLVCSHLSHLREDLSVSAGAVATGPGGTDTRPSAGLRRDPSSRQGPEPDPVSEEEELWG